MSNYLLFFEGARTCNSEQLLDKAGLSSLARDANPEVTVVPQGPTGSAGAIACWRSGKTSHDLLPAFDESQKWAPMAADPDVGREPGAVWIGWDPEKPPLPSELIRKKPFPGSFATLRDGRKWLIPEAFQLQRDFGIDQKTGRWVPVVAPEFETFCLRAEAIAFQFAQVIGKLEELQLSHPELNPKEIEAETSIEDALDMAVEALALNYRVTKEIVANFRLFDRETVVRTICAMVSWNELLEVRDQKKTFEALRIPAASQHTDGFWSIDAV